MKTRRPSSVDQQQDVVGYGVAARRGAAGQRWAAGGFRIRVVAGVTHQRRQERSYARSLTANDLRPGRPAAFVDGSSSSLCRAGDGGDIARPGERASLDRQATAGVFLLLPYLDARQGDNAQAK